MRIFQAQIKRMIEYVLNICVYTTITAAIRVYMLRNCGHIPTHASHLENFR